MVQVEGNKTVGFIFVQYSVIDKNTVRFATIDQEALKAAIASGRIKGETRGEGLSSETVMTSESGDIQAFLSRYGGTLFTRPFVLHRVR